MSLVFDRSWLMESVARELQQRARARGPFDGRLTPANARLLDACTADHVWTGTRLIFTRDVGYHSSGWWKNPDYERCWHLSLSFRDPITGEVAPKNEKLTARWLEAFYGDNRRYIWAEPPYTAGGKRHAAWHYRVFCDPGWQPIVPRGEVYSRELTEAGWLSFSELQAAEEATRLALPR